MNEKRCKIIINNLLNQIVKFTDMYNADKETYFSWLRTEVGLTEEEIKELQDDDCLPEPYYYNCGRNNNDNAE